MPETPPNDVPKLPHEKDPNYCVYPENDEDNPLVITKEMVQNQLYFQKTWAYALPTQKALDTIMLYSGKKGFLEVAAGIGYWASLLEEMHADIIATDIKDKERDKFFKGDHEYTEVIKMDALTAIQEYRDRTLIMVYPHSDDDWPIEVLQVYTGEYLILVYGDGCISDQLGEILWDFWDAVVELSVTHWPIIPAQMTVYQRKPPLNMKTEILTNIHNRVLRLELHTKRHPLTLER
jgi:hypothetical protein